MIRFEVIGLPKAQGSARAFVAGGKARIAAPRGPSKDWRAAIAEVAIEKHHDRNDDAGPGEVSMLGDAEGAVAVAIVFRMPMRKSDQRAAGVKAESPGFVSTKPDRDKMIRAVGDALTASGVVWTDDAQDAVGFEAKVYVPPGEWTGAVIIVGDAESDWEAVVDAGKAEVRQLRAQLVAAKDAAQLARAPRSRAGKRGRGVDAVIGPPMLELATPPTVRAPDVEDFG